MIPTLGRLDALARTLERLAQQTVGTSVFEVVVVADAAEPEPDGVAELVASQPYRCRFLVGPLPGASSTRNAGWRAAGAPLTLFLGNDILAAPDLLARHLEAHRRHPEPEGGVLGHVRWADELEITPFMRWLDRGVQFDFDRIEGEEAGWGRFYTANVSIKREMLERVGGFDPEFTFPYEDLDLGYRLDRRGLRLRYEPRARAEHLHPADLDSWRRRVRQIAAAEALFVRKHPDFRPYFLPIFTAAANRPPARGRMARLGRLIPERTPILGRRVQMSRAAVFEQQLAPAFLRAWEETSGGDNYSPATG